MIVAAQQQVLRGSVYTVNGKPIQGATIQQQGLTRYAVTNELGEFQLLIPTLDSVVLLVRHVAYQPLKLKTSGSPVVIKLEELVTITDEVVIQATRVDESTPITFVNVSKEQLARQNFGQDLPIIIGWSPSVVSTSDAGNGVGYTGIRIRGSDATRVNISINGIPYNDSESLGTFWVNIPDMASSATSLQIQRGVGSSANGGGSFGGAVNVQTAGKTDLPYVRVTTSGGSFNTFRSTLGFGTGLLQNHWTFDGRLSLIQSDGFIDRASSLLKGYSFNAGYYKNKTILKIISFGGNERTYQSWYGVPESRLKSDADAMAITAGNELWNEEQTANLFTSNPRTFNPYIYKNQVDNYAQDHLQLHLSQQFAPNLEGNLSAHYTRGRGYYEEYRYKDPLIQYGLAPVVIGDSTIEAVDLIRRRWLDNHFYGITWSLILDKDRLNFITGGGLNQYIGNHFGEIIWSEVTTVPTGYNFYRSKGSKNEFNTYTKVNYSFTQRLAGYLDLQYRWINYQAGGLENKQVAFAFDKTYHFFNPKAGIQYEVDDHSALYVSYGIANREPVRSDFVDSNGLRNPLPETLRNLEVGYRGTFAKSRWQVNYYFMDYKNQLVLTGKLNDVGANLRTNTPRSYRTGIELDLTLKLLRGLYWTPNLTLSKNIIRTYTEVLYDYGTDFTEYNEINRRYFRTPISFSPEVIAGSALSYSFSEAFTTRLLTKYVGSQYLDNTGNENRKIDAYLVNDLQVQYSLQPKGWKEIVFSFTLNNFLNEIYESNGYTYGYLGGGQEFRENYYYPQAGRNFMVMISVGL